MTMFRTRWARAVVGASALALAQSKMVARDLRAAAARAGTALRVELVEVRTRGDVDPTALARLGGAAVVLEEAALGSRAVDGGCLENPDEGAGVGLKARGNGHTQR